MSLFDATHELVNSTGEGAFIWHAAFYGSKELTWTRAARIESSYNLRLFPLR